VDDQICIAFHIAAIVYVVMNPMAIERKGGIAEQQGGGRLPGLRELSFRKGEVGGRWSMAGEGCFSVDQILYFRQASCA